MDQQDSESLSSIIFEHACKMDFNKTINQILKNEDLVSQVVSDMSSKENNKIRPVFMFISLLKKLEKREGCLTELTQVLPMFINLLETTFRQYNFISHKKYFKFISELKLLDLLNLIAKGSDSPIVLEKLNQYFPRWSSLYQKTIENDFCLDTSSKLLSKVEESHAQCRRLILRLAVDLPFRTKYMSEEYNSDIGRIVKESKLYIKEAAEALEYNAGCSLLEKMIVSEEEVTTNKDLNMHLLFEYIQPNITDDALVRFLDDLPLNSQPSTCLSCLLPFDSSDEEDSDMSESESECSLSGSQENHLKS